MHSLCEAISSAYTEAMASIAYEVSRCRPDELKPGKAFIHGDAVYIVGSISVRPDGFVGVLCGSPDVTESTDYSQRIVLLPSGDPVRCIDPAPLDGRCPEGIVKSEV